MKLSYLFILYLLATTCNSSCAKSYKNKTEALGGQQSRVDTSAVAIIKFDQIGDWPFPNDYSPTTLTFDELYLLDSIIRWHTKTYNESLEGNLLESYGVDFQKFKYKCQYMPVINKKGEKEVWANFFCDIEGDRWRKEILIVHDGGNCFFNLKVNLTTKTCYDISVNGYA